MTSSNDCEGSFYDGRGFGQRPRPVFPAMPGSYQLSLDCGTAEAICMGPTLHLDSARMASTTAPSSAPHKAFEWQHRRRRRERLHDDDVLAVRCKLAADGVHADSRVMSITSNQALFALAGTKFGGDGVSSFSLPAPRRLGPTGLYYVI